MAGKFFRATFEVWWDEDIPFVIFKHMVAWPAVNLNVDIRIEYKCGRNFRVWVEGSDSDKLEAYLTYVTVGSPVLGSVSDIDRSECGERVLRDGATYVNFASVGEGVEDARRREIEDSGIVPETEDEDSMHQVRAVNDEALESMEYLPDAQEFL